MEIPPASLWQECKDDIRRELPPQQFNTWIRPVTFVANDQSDDGPVVTLGVPDDFHGNWLNREYADTLKRVVERIGGPNASLSFQVAPQAPEELILASPDANGRNMQANGLSMNRLQQNAERRDEDMQAVGAQSDDRSIAMNGAGSPTSTSTQPASTPSTSSSKNQDPVRSSNCDTPSKADAMPDIGTLSVRHEDVPGDVPPTLNPHYTFEAFIEADCNRLARSAGVAVANRPGETSFNPFLIYGKVGLGKTHLAHAIGNRIARNAPRTQVLYLTSEAFTNCFVQAIQNNTLSEFTKSFRQIDVLIVDDIQFFGGKEKTQEQFFHLFNDLHQRGKQIILCADRSPAEIAGIEERLLSRFRWGLSADVQPPDLETRTAILQRHCNTHGLDLSPDIIDYIAYNVRDNIRCLEGAFNRLLALRKVSRRTIDLEFARSALSDLVDARTRRSVTAEEIRDIVADYYSLEIDQLIGKSRKRPIVDARQVAMHFCKQMTQLSLEAIGSRFGGRDHSTVIHACKAIQARLDTDPGFETQIEELEHRIENRVSHV